MTEPVSSNTPTEQRDNIELLYKYFGILADSKGNAPKYSNLYEEIIKATKGNSNEKMLACQFIPRFFSRFLNLGDDALNAYFDLCEDRDLSIRKQAIRGLPTFCRDCPEYTKRVADILAQLLQATEPSELTVVRSSLLSLFKINAAATFHGVFNQIKNGDDRVREKCIEFIMTRVRDLPQDIFTLDVEEILVSEIKNVFQDASSDEIQIFFDLLGWTKIGKTTGVKAQILETVMEVLEAEKSNTDDDYIIERYLAFVKTAKHLFSAEVSSNKCIVYFCEEIVPKFNTINGCSEGSGNALDVLKLLAEIAYHVEGLKKTTGVLDALFSLLLEYLPLPTEDEGVSHQKLQFSYVECLLSTMHHLLRENPEYLLSGDKEKLKDFRIRLQYFARASQVYVKTLDEIVKKNRKENVDDVESRIKIMALKTISNINILIKDFFHNPPLYKSTITLSWLAEAKKPQKRKALAPSDTRVLKKQPKTSKSFPQGIYQPPNGKYSSNLFGAR